MKHASVVVGLTTLLLAGCSSVKPDMNLQRANADTAAFTQGQLALAQTADERTARNAAATRLLQQVLTQNDAVLLALQHSPDLQAMLADHAANSARIAQAGRIANPLLNLSRVRTGEELAFERTLSFGLLDLILLPQRQKVARQRLDAAQLNLASAVIAQVTQVRMAWVRAVAAQQALGYARQVVDSAEATAELARRMQAAGNFSRLMRVRQQVFYADATTQLANAQHQVIATREALVRTLGLDQAQADLLQLPSRLPDLPEQPRDATSVEQAAFSNRLDIRIARQSFDAAAQAQGLNLPQSVLDLDLGIRRDTRTEGSSGPVPGRGLELTFRLPLFDAGDQQRAAMNAQTLAQANRLQASLINASSHLRETYSAYRTQHDIARHYREEVIPLRKIILDENVLRYNGMLAGVFDLLVDVREQIRGVLGAIEAEQQFWLADAALQAEMVGTPVMMTGGDMMGNNMMSETGGNHE